jgi:hypothetical protein
MIDTPRKKSAKQTIPIKTSERMMTVRLRALEMPPIKDGLVIGTKAAIGAEAMTRTLRLMSNEKFELINFKDEIVEAIIVRLAILKKVGKDRLVDFVMKRVKPLMAESELLMLDIHVELVIEDSL